MSCLSFQSVIIGTPSYAFPLRTSRKSSMMTRPHLPGSQPCVALASSTWRGLQQSWANWPDWLRGSAISGWHSTGKTLWRSPISPQSCSAKPLFNNWAPHHIANCWIFHWSHWAGARHRACLKTFIYPFSREKKSSQMKEVLEFSLYDITVSKNASTSQISVALIHFGSMETQVSWPFITLTYCRADYLRTEMRKTTVKHSSFSKPEELPGALSQNRGLERKAFPLPADELMLLEVKRLQTDAEGLPPEKLGCFTSRASKRAMQTEHGR